MVEIIETGAGGTRIVRAQPLELGIKSRAFRAVAVDEIQQAAADALDRGNVERLLPRRNAGGLRAKRNRPLIGLLRIDHAERHRRRARAMGGNEVEAVAARLIVDEVIDVA